MSATQDPKRLIAHILRPDRLRLIDLAELSQEISNAEQSIQDLLQAYRQLLYGLEKTTVQRKLEKDALLTGALHGVQDASLAPAAAELARRLGLLHDARAARDAQLTDTLQARLAASLAQWPPARLPAMLAPFGSVRAAYVAAKGALKDARAAGAQPAVLAPLQAAKDARRRDAETEGTLALYQLLRHAHALRSELLELLAALDAAWASYAARLAALPPLAPEVMAAARAALPSPEGQLDAAVPHAPPPAAAPAVALRGNDSPQHAASPGNPSPLAASSGGWTVGSLRGSGAALAPSPTLSPPRSPRQNRNAVSPMRGASLSQALATVTAAPASSSGSARSPRTLSPPRVSPRSGMAALGVSRERSPSVRPGAARGSSGSMSPAVTSLNSSAEGGVPATSAVKEVGRPPAASSERLVFEVAKVSLRKKPLRTSVPATLEVDLAARSVCTYHITKQARKVFGIEAVLQLARSKVDTRKCKVLWAHRPDAPARYVFASHADRERFILACTSLQQQQQQLQAAGQALLAGKGQQVELYLTSWNMGNAPPPPSADFGDWLRKGGALSSSWPSLYVVALQESEFTASPGYASAEDELGSKLLAALGERYARLAAFSLQAIRLLLFVRRDQFYLVSQLRKTKQPTGIAGVYGNKGAVAVALRFRDTELCFVGAHFAAREERVRQRNDNFRDIVAGVRLQKEPFDCTTWFGHVFWLGDLNYRVLGPREQVLERVRERQLDELLQTDQLRSEHAAGHVLAGFREAPIQFAPTYRYNRGDRSFSDEKLRNPSWCDRVLVRSQPALEPALCQTLYTACADITTSDHNPVIALFRLDAPPHTVPLPPERPPPPLRIALSGVQVELVGESAALLAAKPGWEPQLHVHAACVDDAALRPAPLRRAPASAAPAAFVAADDVVLQPFHSARPFLRLQHVLVCAKDHRGEVGQAALALAPACDDPSGAPFSAPLLVRGRLGGHIRGRLQLVPLPRPQLPLAPASGSSSSSSEPLEPGSTISTISAGSAIGAAAAFASSGDKSGYLLKQGAIKRNWKRRWFELRNGTMSYYLSKESRQLFGSFSVRGAHVADASVHAVGKHNGLFIATPKRTWILCADSPADTAAWIEAVKRAAV